MPAGFGLRAFFVRSIWWKLALALFDRMCYNKMNYVDNTVGVYACHTHRIKEYIGMCKYGG